jgi:hypothetical protein
MPEAVQHDIKKLPDEVLRFLVGSRYCDTVGLVTSPEQILATPLPAS